MDWLVTDNELAVFGVGFLHTVGLHFYKPLQGKVLTYKELDESRHI